MSDSEEMELARHLERLEEQNREISGDEASDESSGPEDDGEGDKPPKNATAVKDATVEDDDIEIEDDDV